MLPANSNHKHAHASAEAVAATAGEATASVSPANQSTGNVGGSAGRLHSSHHPLTGSPASVPVDTPLNDNYARIIHLGEVH